MKYFLSDADYDRVTAGMTETERGEIDRLFWRYSDYRELFAVDQDRIAARFADLLADQHQPVRPVVAGGRPGPHLWDWGPDPVNGKSWAQMYDEASALWPDPGAETWMRLADLEDAARASQDDHARGWERIMRLVDQDRQSTSGIISDAVPNPEAPGDALTAMRLWMNKHQQADRSRPSRLEAGETALAAILATVTREPKAASWSSGEAGMALLTGIPIVPNDEDLEPGQWRLVDTQTGEVLKEGAVSPDLGEYVRVAEEATEQAFDEAGVPRNLRPW